ncbi:Sigma-70 family RNA polymerase sigma factor [Sulfidibacter corallicola]|uniref:Sigma-70 family RNA polymerase sigma factor n=1 Tax=Sulfidibacter corallicola TaxID=2818388 RepID=A0A8A4TJ64_SULCO|nr:sigma-70 family RNA polymerase sigma factor [Sulfidibacter corallicola]QTD49527.1 sigma-70 family RNA polymerase sigma factor [Sulfidibacter corallicola]
METVIASIHRYNAGDRDAFEPIHEYYKNRLWAYLCSRANNRDDAEELFSNVCMTIARRLPTLKEPEKLIAWVIGIAHFKVRERYKSPSMKSVCVDDFAEELEDGCATPEENLVTHQSLEQLHDCMKQLPDHQREYIELQYLAGVPQKDVAEQFHLNTAALKSQIFRAKVKLLHCLRKHGILPHEEAAGSALPKTASRRSGRKLSPVADAG